MARGYKKYLEVDMEILRRDDVVPVEFIGFESKPETEEKTLEENVSLGCRWVWS